MTKATLPAEPGQFGANDVTVLQDELSFKGFFSLRTLHIRHPRFNGGDLSITRELFVRGRAVAVLLFDLALESVVLVEQFRTGAFYQSPARMQGREGQVNAWQLELVAGIVEPHESDEDVAMRESEEESGASVQGIFPMLDYLVSPGGTNERIGLYCALVDASALGGVHGLEGEGEDIRVHVMPLAEAAKACDDGRIDNAATLLGLQWFQLHRERAMAFWRENGLV